MKKCALLTCLAGLVGCGSTHTRELARDASPNGKSTVVLTRKEKRGFPWPGPEPPRVTARLTRLTLLKDGKTVYDTGFEQVGDDQNSPFAFDLAWAPDSSQLAYRVLNTLQIISGEGEVRPFNIVKDNALVSSFKWISSDELLIVSKGIDEPLDSYGYPVHYYGYLANSTYVKVSRIHLESGVTERFKQEVNKPTFLFHSIGFENQEISPYSSRVAFSDGTNINVYDDSEGAITAKAPVEGSINGIWWQDDNTVILKLRQISNEPKRFLTFNANDTTIKDATGKLLPRWDGSYLNADWFKQAEE